MVKDENSSQMSVIPEPTIYLTLAFKKKTIKFSFVVCQFSQNAMIALPYFSCRLYWETKCIARCSVCETSQLFNYFFAWFVL